jgi:putative aldouronate transport system permease protein
MRYRTTAGTIFDTINYLFMLVLVVVFFYPFWDTLVLSFSTPEQATSLGLRVFPSPISVEAYVRVFNSGLIFVGYANTIYRTVVGTILTLFVTYLGSYALAKRDLPFRSPITLLILFTMFFDGGLIATYLNIKSLGLLGSRWALILPLATSSWNLIIARNFMMTLPQELEDAAMVDGASILTIIFRLMLPLSAPILAVLALWTAVAHWNAWFDALLYVSGRNKMVLQLMLRKILIEESEEMLRNLTLSTTASTPETVKGATIMVSILPIIMFYPFLQKYFVKGILVGSLKG